MLSILEEHRLPVGAIVGVSAGGLVGVLYGLGYSPQAIRDYIARTSLLEVWDFDPSQRAIFGPDKIRARLREAVGGKTFADLKLLVTVLALDMNTEREIYLNSGGLEEALLATMAIPGFFTPVELNGMLLADGGVLNPLPVDVARGLGRVSSRWMCSTITRRLNRRKSSRRAGRCSMLTTLRGGGESGFVRL